MDDLAAFSKALDGFIRTLTAQMHDVSQTAAKLGDGFAGAVASAVAQAHTEWQSDGAALIGRFAEYRLMIDNCHYNYAQARRANCETLGLPTT
ncbi:WXG100 family type VII secretion target [Nocardia amikacinitolerans]|uniref:WXG100 family type VII secretion target n=1 Tax=Nocardia amikacinitolerans TaxID=756689 RepID=UPI00117D2876|nr:hypothetical protein [Nocardia amikacinitolerans]